MGLTRRQFVHSIPMYLTYGLGAVICGTFALWAAALYVALCIAGNLWYIRTICVHCAAYGSGCPSGYNLLARRMARPGGRRGFGRAFRRNVASVVPCWFLPLLLGGLLLYVRSDPWNAMLLGIFCIMAFGVLPFGMRAEGCARCPNRRHCPYTATHAGDGSR